MNYRNANLNTNLVMAIFTLVHLLLDNPKKKINKYSQYHKILIIYCYLLLNNYITLKKNKATH